MRIALVADLHGNRPATLALERALPGCNPTGCCVWAIL